MPRQRCRPRPECSIALFSLQPAVGPSLVDILVLQVSFNTERRTLADLARSETGVLESLDLPQEFAHRLMLLGFIPGITVEAAHSAPGGDPRIYRVDGSEIALRHATAASLILRHGESSDVAHKG